MPITSSRMALEIKVGWVSESSGSSLDSNPDFIPSVILEWVLAVSNIEAFFGTPYRQNRVVSCKTPQNMTIPPQPIRAQCQGGWEPIRSRDGRNMQNILIADKKLTQSSSLRSFLWWKLGVSQFTESRTSSHWIETLEWFLHMTDDFFPWHVRSPTSFLWESIYTEIVQWTLKIRYGVLLKPMKEPFLSL